MTLFQTTLPSIGPGELKRREDGQKSSPKVSLSEFILTLIEVFVMFTIYSTVFVL